MFHLCCYWTPTGVHASLFFLRRNKAYKSHIVLPICLLHHSCSLPSLPANIFYFFHYIKDPLFSLTVSAFSLLPGLFFSPTIKKIPFLSIRKRMSLFGLGRSVWLRNYKMGCFCFSIVLIGRNFVDHDVGYEFCVFSCFLIGASWLE